MAAVGGKAGGRQGAGIATGPDMHVGRREGGRSLGGEEGAEWGKRTHTAPIPLMIGNSLV